VRARSCLLSPIVFSVLCGFGWISNAWAAGEPERSPSPTPPQEELIPELPAFLLVWSGVPEPLRLFVAEPFGPLDKGGAYTDMGAGRAPHLTEREQALLALGRAAIEASRANGTLEVPRRPSTPADAGENTEQAKKDLLRRSPAPPVLGTGSPADFTSQQAVTDPAPLAPTPLTPAELEKLAAARDASSETNPSVEED